MRLGLPPRARLPQATPADALRVGTLDPCPRGILLREGVGRLPVSCGLKRLVRLPGVESYEAGLLRGARDACTRSTLCSSGVVAGVVSIWTITWGVSASHVSVRWTL
jgi:hypothetical protein